MSEKTSTASQYKPSRRLTSGRSVQFRHHKIEQRILRLSMIGCLVFLATEILMAALTRSRALFSDCLWDSVDLILLIPMLLLEPRLSRKKVSEKRSFGFYPVESLLVVGKTFVLLILSVVLIAENILSILHGGNRVDTGIIALYEILVSIFCMVFYLIMKRMEHSFESPMVGTEVYTWKMDSFSTLGVSAGFAFAFLIGWTPLRFLSPYIDPAIAILVNLALIREPLSMLRENLHDLLLFAPEKEIMDDLREKVTKHLEGSSYQETFLDVVKTGRMFWIGIYFTPKTDEIRFSEIRSLVRELSEDLRKDYDDIYVEMIPDTSVPSEHADRLS